MIAGHDEFQGGLRVLWVDLEYYLWQLNPVSVREVHSVNVGYMFNYSAVLSKK